VVGDRPVAPQPPTQLSLLTDDARKALRAPEPDPAADALEQLIGLRAW
jgi:hypothetical protein